MAAERKNLRILMTADTVGGVWPFAIELAAQLARSGDRVLLAAMGREPDAAQRQQAAAIPGLELHARPYKLVWMHDPWRDLDATGTWLHELVSEFAPDVVHLNDLALGDAGWPAPVLMTAHSCVCSWWQAVHATPAPAAWNRYRACVTASLHAADVVVAPTRAMLRMLTTQYSALPGSRVIHNGRSAGSRANTVARANAVKQPFVLAAGRVWDQGKNLAALATVAPRLQWPVYLAGEARHPDGGGIALANVHALGALPDALLRDWMTQAAIYALPARYEPFGLTALEAAQSRCALVLGDIPSLREVWGDAALFVAPDDHDALAAALRRLIDDGALRTYLANRARIRARRYTPAAMAARYRDAYADVIARRRAPRAIGRPHALPVAAGAHA